MHRHEYGRTALLALIAIIGLSGTMNARAQNAAPNRPAADRAEDAFLTQSATAMNRMMSGMAIKPAGDVDADFAAMMIAHHLGAIDMALAELRHGKNEQLRRIAQEIIVEQQQEIVAMRLALGQPPQPKQEGPNR
jgi:uncharacterized protein (DUF305 family)